MKSNLFFYAKYRPVSLDDFLCNTKTVQISNSDSVTFITGESGNGKTTLAKLLAKGYGSYTEFDYTNLVEEISNCDSNSIIIDECNFFTKEQQLALSKVISKLVKKGKHIFICVTSDELLYQCMLNVCDRIITVNKPSSITLLPELRYICKNEKVFCSDKELKEIVISNKTMREVMVELNKLVCLRKVV